MLNPSEHVLDYVDDYAHQALDDAQMAVVETHLRRCRVCQAALEEAEARKAALKSLPPLEASEELIQRTLGSTIMRGERRASIRRSVARVALAVAALAALAIGAAHLHFARLSPSPYDLRILGQSELLAGAKASLRVAVIDRRTGQAVQGVPVEIGLHPRGQGKLPQPVTLVSYSTGEEGAASFTLPDWRATNCELRIAAQVGGQEELLVKPVKLKRAWRLHLSCDKPIYQPGQTIRLRALALRQPDLKPVAGEKAVFTISDPKGNVIFKQADVTSKFGIVSAECPLASEILEGAYRLVCQVGGDSSGDSSGDAAGGSSGGAATSERTVEVRKYVLPKFRVAVSTDKPFYGPGEEVVATVQADYFFGQPVAKGQVQFEARGRDVEQYPIATQSGITSDSGKAEFRFRLPEQFVGREQEGGQGRFELAASVTDSAGQSYAAGTSRVVAANPIQIDVAPEDGSLVAGVTNRVFVMTTYADGRPAQTDLVVHGASAEAKTNDLGVAVIEVVPPAQGNLSLTIKATDGEGRIGRTAVTLASLAGNPRDFLLRTDKAVYEAGETMTVTVLGAGVEPVFLDFLKDDQTMFTQTIDLQNGSGQSQIDLPADLFGAVRLVAYRFGPSGLPVRKSRALFLRQAGGLKIEATLDSAEYRPGETAKLRLQLTDADGKATAGAVSLAAVDEAVFAVLNQSAGMERTFFLLEEELLKPVYAIYSNWSPDAYPQISSEERGLFEQALFSRTASGASVGGREGESFFTGGEADNTFKSAFQPQASPSGAGPLNAPAWSLTAASYPDKAAKVSRRRQQGLDGVSVAWALYFASLLLGGVIAFAVLKTRVFLITAAVLAVLCVFVTPAVLLVMMVTLGAQKTAEVTGMAELSRSAEYDASFLATDMAPTAAGVAPPMALEESTAEDDASAEGGEAPPAAQPIRVRQWFPETLLWRPEVVTDDAGQATVDIELADSITQWRLSASAVSAAGQLGGGDFPIKVFQPFFVDLNLPVSLTRNDQVSVPVVVYNYLDAPQTVTIEVQPSEWFERTGESAGEPLKVSLAPREIRAASLPIRVLKVGRWKLEVAARSDGAEPAAADAISREIEVVSDGQKHEQVASGVLDGRAEFPFSIPDDAIEGSVRATVKFYPSAFSQLVEGLDAIFAMPSGCFEQTSSTTYPNVLALDYLKRTGKAAPQIEARARQYVHLGYQRLLGFEIPSGGFDWYGNPPANVSLSAYGLLEFRDMAKVHDVDPNVIARTRNWLLAQRRPDGAWAADGRSFHGLDSLREQLELATTAYVAWAVFSGGDFSAEAAPTLDYLLAHEPATVDDPYVLSLIIAAVAAIDSSHTAIGGYVERLVSLKQGDADGKRVFWRQPGQARTMFHGAGPAGEVETTAMAALALLAAREHPLLTRGALAWLVEQKDARGAWHSTQATVLALKALLAGTGQPLGDNAQRRLAVTLNGEEIQSLEIPADQAEVMRQVDLSRLFTPGQRRLELSESTETGTTYQVIVSYHSPADGDAPTTGAPPPLSIDIAYDRQRLEVDQTVSTVATVVSNMSEAAPMVILDLPIPGGFLLERGELDELVGSGAIAKYEITPRQAIVYLRELPAGGKLELRYRLRATMPVKVSVPAGQVYEYYNPANRAQSNATELEAVES